MDDGEIEFLFQFPEAALRKTRPPSCKLLHLGIIIDIEMLCLEHLPVEIRMADLVAAEREELGLGTLRRNTQT